MIRIIVRFDDGYLAANLGGAVLTRFKTFDVDLPEVEAALMAGGQSETAFAHGQIVGCEIISEPVQGEQT